MRVLDIDPARRRIALTARKEGGGKPSNEKSRGKNNRSNRRESSNGGKGFSNTPLAALRDREKSK